MSNDKQIVVFNPSKERSGIVNIEIEPMPEGIISIELKDEAVRGQFHRNLAANTPSAPGEDVSAAEIQRRSKVEDVSKVAPTTSRITIRFDKSEDGQALRAKFLPLALETSDPTVREVENMYPGRGALNIRGDQIAAALDLMVTEGAITEEVKGKIQQRVNEPRGRGR